MKAISLWQPWASAMALGLKTIETRHWSTNVRGLVAIHAAKRWTREEREDAEDFARSFNCPALIEPPLGAILALGHLVSVVRVETLRDDISDMERAFGNYGNARFAWQFAHVVSLPEPIPFKGAQGFFEVPDDLSAIVPEMPPAPAIRPPMPPKAAPQPDLFGARHAQP